MEIRTLTQTQSESHEIGKIVIDDTIDMVVVKKNNKYIINVVKNNCFEVEVNEVEFSDEE